MSTFFEANQARYLLKMNLVNYWWFRNATVIAGEDGYDVVVSLAKIDNLVKKIVPRIINGVGIKLELE